MTNCYDAIHWIQVAPIHQVKNVNLLINGISYDITKALTGRDGIYIQVPRADNFKVEFSAYYPVGVLLNHAECFVEESSLESLFFMIKDNGEIFTQPYCKKREHFEYEP